MEIVKIHRYLSGEAKQAERTEFETWLRLSEKNRETYEGYKRIYEIEIRHKYTYNTEAALARFRQIMKEDTRRAAPGKYRYHREARKSGFGVWWKAAAILVITLGLSVYLLTDHRRISDEAVIADVTGTTITTLPGEQKSLRLQDGSRVRLNADSELYVAVDFGEQERRVTLKGEAFFEVAQNPELSFTVQTETAEVEVLGTSFGVRAWKQREESLIAVQSGVVSIRSANPEVSETTILRAGEYSRVEMDKAPTVAQQTNIDQYISWIDRAFVFEETPLRDVLMQLELYFNVVITIDDSSSIDDPVTAQYRNESLKEILEYTSITHGVNFKVETRP